MWAEFNEKGWNEKGAEGQFWAMLAFRIWVDKLKKKTKRQMTSEFRNKQTNQEKIMSRKWEKQLQEGLFLIQAASCHESVLSFALSGSPFSLWKAFIPAHL